MALVDELITLRYVGHVIMGTLSGDSSDVEDPTINKMFEAGQSNEMVVTLQKKLSDERFD